MAKSKRKRVPKTVLKLVLPEHFVERQLLSPKSVSWIE
jgi:hypothetical protein